MLSPCLHQKTLLENDGYVLMDSIPVAEFPKVQGLKSASFVPKICD